MSYQLPIKCGYMCFEIRFSTLLLVAAATALLCSCALAQCPTGTTSPGNVLEPAWGSNCPSSGQTDKNCSYYSWQVSPDCVNGVASTLTLTTEMGLVGPTYTGPTGPALSPPISLPSSPFTVHEVHGNVAFTLQSHASCNFESVIAQVRNQSGNTIAGVNLGGAHPGDSHGSYNLPIRATLAIPLPITSLQLVTNATQCGGVTISWSLVMH